MKIETVALTEVINSCFDLSMDLRFSMQDRKGFLTEGKRLRGLLLNLISAQFAAGTAQVVETNAQIVQINTDLSNTAQSLANTAQRLADLAQLVASLDGLIGIAATFI